jgi:alpha/beta superfamily hydrolase
MRIWFFLFLLVFSLQARTQDYQREKRWAAEVVPNLVVGDGVQIALQSGRSFLGIYAAGQASVPAVLLVHGIGVHPDHGVIGVLRVALSEMGHATLSLQMPVLRSEAGPADYDAAVFAEAIERISAGARWLREKSGARPVLLSHSLGSRMANAYFEAHPNARFAAWICLGMSGNFTRVDAVRAPVLDVYGESDLAPVLRDAWRRRVALNALSGSNQAMIAGADHHYNGREKELASVIRAFLDPLK